MCPTMGKNETHILKRCVSDYESLLNNTKTFEVIFAIAKDINIGDKILIKETKFLNCNGKYFPNYKSSHYWSYTGRQLLKEISYICEADDYIEEEDVEHYCIVGLK